MLRLLGGVEGGHEAGGGGRRREEAGGHGRKADAGRQAEKARTPHKDVGKNEARRSSGLYSTNFFTTHFPNLGARARKRCFCRFRAWFLQKHMELAPSARKGAAWCFSSCANRELRCDRS